jgi:hypothetical protein
MIEGFLQRFNPSGVNTSKGFYKMIEGFLQRFNPSGVNTSKGFLQNDRVVYY